MNKGRKLAFVFWGTCLILAIICFVIWFFYWRYYKYTDDAYVQGNQVYITPFHPGFVTSIQTDDSFLVEKGQLLVTMDETDAKIALERAKEGLSQTVRQVCEMFHQVSVYRAEIDLKTAELIRDAQDYLHRSKVYREEGVSLEDYEHSIAALRAQYASLEMTGALYQKALSAVQGTSLQNHPLVVAASDQLRDAWVRLYRCKIYSPVKGLAAQRTVQVGMWVPAGQPLMSIIPLDQIWVNANYKETQLKAMRIGQKVDITVDLWGSDEIFHGTVIGLPGGAGNAFSLLPPQNLSGNWIKIVQRLPVRVALLPQEIQERPLRLGLSCKAYVDIRDRKGRLIPDTNHGSPHYQTSIYEVEEKGDQNLIADVIAANVDPNLSEYREKELDLPEIAICLPPLMKEAIRLDEMLQNQIVESLGKDAAGD
ncbi:MAG: multidrug transporter [Chlamydiae bacterium CG10_big_fil_rev_8_21_14_0_10_42_34]|nr:MAG: multidrug transporter [Chlamydiae bacterium CG10_big_fil_rev_8_21_14_0_10_42_34]